MRHRILAILFPVMALSCAGGSSKCPIPDPGPVEDPGPAVDPGTTSEEVTPIDVRLETGWDLSSEPTKGGFGAACSSNADCDSGYCVEGAEGLVCTMTCQQDCPPDWACRATTLGSDVISLCIPEGANLCKPCKVDTQCGGGMCLAVGDGKFCGRDCSSSTCPAGYTCKDVSASGEAPVGRQCVPNSGACDCTMISQGTEKPCVKKNDIGTCLGFATCDPQAGWVDCSAIEPKPEECNGVDDNCNGVADDSPAKPVEACLKTIPDVGSCPCQGRARANPGGTGSARIRRWRRATTRTTIATGARTRGSRTTRACTTRRRTAASAATPATARCRSPRP